MVNPDLNLLLPAAHMMNRVRQIIGDDFLYFKFIAHDVDRFLPVKIHSQLILLKQHTGRRNHTGNQLRQVKPLHRQPFSPKFQRRQGQKLTHHPIHFPSLVHDNAAVIIAVLLVLRHALDESFRIALNQRDRRL